MFLVIIRDNSLRVKRHFRCPGGTIVGAMVASPVDMRAGRVEVTTILLSFRRSFVSDFY